MRSQQILQRWWETASPRRRHAGTVSFQRKTSAALFPSVSMRNRNPPLRFFAMRRTCLPSSQGAHDITAQSRVEATANVYSKKIKNSGIWSRYMEKKKRHPETKEEWTKNHASTNRDNEDGIATKQGGGGAEKRTLYYGNRRALAYTIRSRGQPNKSWLISGWCMATTIYVYKYIFMVIRSIYTDNTWRGANT